MKAIVCQSPGHLEVVELPMPEAKAEEALLRIKNVGICGTDLHAYAGNQPFFSYPRILGHELGAEITSLPQEYLGDLKAGDHVVVVPYLSCGHCITCRSGRTNCCTSLKVLGVHVDGGMQEYFYHPVDLLLKADELTTAEKSIVEPLCIGRHAVERAQIQPGQWVVVSGCGPIGVGIIWSAKAKGAKVIAVDVDERRLAFCKRHFQIAHTLKAGENLLSEIADITQGDMAEIAFDATGLKTPMEKGVEFLSAGGKYILVGLNKGDLAFNHPYIHAREITILCSRNATKADFAGVIAEMSRGTFPSDAYISHKADFSVIPNHFDIWKDPANEVMKVVTIW